MQVQSLYFLIWYGQSITYQCLLFKFIYAKQKLASHYDG